MQKSFWVYIMCSKTGTLYTGVTNSLDRRVFEHKYHLNPGSFTARYHCTRLAWFEEWASPIRAIAREKQIKSWTRKKRITLIESLNPHWTDLAEHWGAELCTKIGITADPTESPN
jgi:putative endonuclease